MYFDVQILSHESQNHLKHNDIFLLQLPEFHIQNVPVFNFKKLNRFNFGSCNNSFSKVNIFQAPLGR